MLPSTLVKTLRKLDHWLVLIGLAVSLGVNVYFATARSRQESGPSLTNLVGAKLPALSLLTLSGNTVQLGWRSDKRATLVYIFSPKCGWCARNLENIKALSASLRSQYRFVGISLLDAGLAKYVSQHDLVFETYSSPHLANGQKFGKFGSITPETLIVDGDGNVKHDWQGAYTSGVQKEIESLMGVKLPGLTAAPQKASTEPADRSF